MSKYNTLNVKLSNSQLKKLKSGMKNCTEVTSFPHKLLLTNINILRLCKAFANGSSANIKLSKTQFPKIMQLGGFLADLLASIPKVIFHTEVEALKRGIKEA